MNNRITPAYAGKTYGKSVGTSPGRDHPRLRGKDKDIEGQLSADTGSPPLTRERPSGQKDRAKKQGITPAYAGKTDVLEEDEENPPDHPRLRGKDL